jgi:hypothetical protein
MDKKQDAPPFAVAVEAGFAEDGIWVIDARLRFRDGAPPKVGSTLLGEGRCALLEAITREGARGRALGATKVQVRMDTDDGIRDVGMVEIIPETLH